MLNRKNLLAVLSLLLVAAFVLSACQPQVQEVIKTVEVEKQVEVVKTVEVEKQVEVVKTEIVEVQRGSFSTPHPFLSDINLRQAMAYCTNKLEVIASVYPLVSSEEQAALVMNTFIPSTSWAYAGDQNITIYPFDPEKGKQILEDAGYTLEEGNDFRTAPDGSELSLRFTTTTAAFRQTWAAVWEQQMAACGIRIVRLHAPASWWFGDTTGLSKRDFELGAFAWVGQADPSGRTLWACDRIPLPENNWAGQNYMGWCNEAADAGIKQATNSLSQEERKQGYTIVQQEYTKDLPAIPMFNRTETYAVVKDFVNFKPNPGTAYYQWNAYEWEVPGSDTIVLGFTQEPASLFSLVESALVANQALSLIYGFDFTDQNFSYQARMQNELPTVDSGLASNNDVTVKEGDEVYDAEGSLVELAAGVKIINAAGETVEYTGGEAQLKQLVVTYNWVDGLTWSDGEPLKQADFELAYKINCDRESGATDFTICDSIQSIDFVDDNTLTVTFKPGRQDPTYFLAPWGNFSSFYPSHQVIGSGSYAGQTLADVPAKDWTTLPEVAELPLGVGPYVLKEWVKGEKMVYEANPYFYLGAPKTPNLVISFVTAENAEAQLLGGQIDTLDGTTLVGVTESLKAAEEAGQIDVIVEPSATWEHIDINTFIQ